MCSQIALINQHVITVLWLLTSLTQEPFKIPQDLIPNFLLPLDAPDDVIYIVFGVIIAMLIAAVTIVLVAVTIR